jgi:hypothetical protein
MVDSRCRVRAVAGAAVALALLGACAGANGDETAADPPPEVLAEGSAPSRPVLVDVAADQGVDAVHGAFRWEATADPVAMMGAGVCWLDADDDGLLDLYMVNSYAERESRRWDDEGRRPVNHLYRNDGDGFTDVSAGSGADLAVRGTGCVAADLDLDGSTDLFVTTARQNVLLWGRGDGTFTEGTEAAGVDAYGWHGGAAVGDVDGDGLPDLFVAGYADLTRAVAEATQGFPNTYGGEPDLLYLNQGPGPDGRPTFRDVAPELQIDREAHYGLGALLTDVDGDRDLDLYVANDTNPNDLYLNEPRQQSAPGRDLGFALREAGAEAGVDDPNSGMGVAGDDYDGDGRSDLFVTNHAEQTHGLFHNRSEDGTVAFTDGLGRFGYQDLGVGLTGWGTRFADLDLDTDTDLVVADGYVPVTDLSADAQPLVGYSNLTAGGEAGAFEEVSDSLGLDTVGPLNARGLAAADYDNDGDVDVAVNVVGSPLVLLENRGASGNWLQVATGEFSPGAVVTVRLADGRELRRELQAGSSYLSSEDPRAHFGLGDETTVAEVRVAWPGGGTTVVEDVAANQTLTVNQGDP